MYYAVCHHGTAGIGASFGYAELLDDETIGDLRQSQTCTVYGFENKDRAQLEVDRLNKECDEYRNTR